MRYITVTGQVLFFIQSNEVALFTYASAALVSLSGVRRYDGGRHAIMLDDPIAFGKVCPLPPLYFPSTVFYLYV